MRDVLLIFHFIGLAMGLGTSIAFMFLGIAASKMEKKEMDQFRINVFALSKMGHIGLTLLVISGLLLMQPYWSVLMSQHIILTKLVLVLVLGMLIGMISSTAKKAKKNPDERHFKKIETLGKLSLVTGIAIVVLAVFAFH